MTVPVTSAVKAVKAIRDSAGYRQLAAAERLELDSHLSRLENVLRPRSAHADPYSPAALATPYDLDVTGRSGGGGAAPAPPAGTAPTPPPPSTPAGRLDRIGAQAADALESVNFTGFVGGLLQGTFQAIVDSTLEQVRQYAALVRELSRTVDEFTRDNVAPEQTRAELARRYPSDLLVRVPAPGRPGAPALVPKPEADGSSPVWLGDYDLAGEALTEELCEGRLLQNARTNVGEERMKHLATLVLLGISRVVVDDGDIRARLQFHASARERTDVELGQTQASEGIAGRTSSPAALMVSTMRANAQADASIRAELMGEVRIHFRTDTFALERFADSAAIQLISRHARPAGSPTPPTSPVPPAPSSGGGGETT